MVSLADASLFLGDRSTDCVKIALGQRSLIRMCEVATTEQKNRNNCSELYIHQL